MLKLQLENDVLPSFRSLNSLAYRPASLLPLQMVSGKRPPAYLTTACTLPYPLQVASA